MEGDALAARRTRGKATGRTRHRSGDLIETTDHVVTSADCDRSSP